MAAITASQPARAPWKRAKLLRWVLFAVVAGLLHLAYTPAPAYAADEICQLMSDGTLSCPSDPSNEPTPAFAPPELLNPRIVAAATPAQAQTLRRLQEKALDGVMARHGLPAGDRDAVKSWARSEAQAQLFASVVDAISMPSASRTSDQQNAVDWMRGLVHDQNLAAARHAGAEYARWAGLDVHDYWTHQVSATESELTTFLSTQPVSYNSGSTTCGWTTCTTTTDGSTGGYCSYRSPAPYETEYTGHTTQTCYRPCTGLYCAPPAPTFDQFVRWGQAVASSDWTRGDFQVSAQSIVAGIVAVGTLWGAGIAAAVAPFAFDLALAMGVSIATAMTSLTTTTWGVMLGAASFSMQMAAVVVVVAMLAALVMTSIDFANQTALPGKLASFVVHARTATPDLATMVSTSEGRTMLVSLFTAAVAPFPRTDQRCDNALIPVESYGLPGVDGVTIYDAETNRPRIVSTRPCLNTTPIPAASETNDPHWVVKRVDAQYAVRQGSLTLPMPGVEGATSAVRVSDRWFVARVQRDGATIDQQTLGLTYRAWDGQQSYAQLDREPTGEYRFMGVTQGLAHELDPRTCLDVGTCWADRNLQYLGLDGAKYVAHLEAYQPPVGSPSHSERPTVMLPVDFDADGFAPAWADAPMQYQWRFQKDSCGGPCVTIDNGKSVPVYSLPQPGSTTSYRWRVAGTYSVELVATNAADQRLVTTIEVVVASYPPRLTLLPDCATTVNAPCFPHTWDQHTQGNLWAQVSHDIIDVSETERVTVDWGDGSRDTRTHYHDGRADDPNASLRFGEMSASTFMVSATHIYRAAGTYHGTVAVRDDVEGLTRTEEFTITVRPPIPQTGT